MSLMINFNVLWIDLFFIFISFEISFDKFGEIWLVKFIKIFIKMKKFIVNEFQWTAVVRVIRQSRNRIRKISQKKCQKSFNLCYISNYFRFRSFWRVFEKINNTNKWQNNLRLTILWSHKKVIKIIPFETYVNVNTER